MTTAHRTYNQLCPVATALDALGDRWTVLILRDLLWRGPHGYQQLLDANPGMSPGLLSTRLGDLAEHGLVEKIEVRDGRRSAVYRLTPSGHRVKPVVDALYRFGAETIAAVPLTLEKVRYVLTLAATNLGNDIYALRERNVRLTVDELSVVVAMRPGEVQVVDGPESVDASVSLTQESLIDLIGGSDVSSSSTGDAGAAEQLLAVVRRATV